MKVFPTRHFFFQGLSADIDRRTISGGTAISGSEAVVATDGGGRVVAEFSEAYLDDPRAAQAWRALDALLDGGATPIIVPLGDARTQMMGDVRLPAGGLPWWNDTDFIGTDTGAKTAGAVGLRATTMTVDVSNLPGPVRPGQWFSIRHANRRDRAYKVAEVTAENGTTTTFKFRPPLREATPANTPVDFSDPKCVMRVEGGMSSPTSFGFVDGASVRFVEHFADSYA